MTDVRGDKTKQPPECEPVFTPHPEPKPRGAVGTGVWSKCPNLKEAGGGMESEHYSCEVCGDSYTLYYEDMA